MGLDLSALDGDLVIGRPVVADGTAMRAPLASFEEDPDNPRFESDPAGFALLVGDVRERGILQPIIVRRLETGKLQIRFGSRRYRAAVQLGLPDAPYVVTEDPRQFDDYAQVAENERRSGLQPLELATFIARKLAQGEKKKVVADRLGIHPSSVTHLLCLTGAVPAFLLELYHGRKCRSAQYLYELRGMWEQDPQLVETGCAAASEIDRAWIEALSAALREAARASHGQLAQPPGAASEPAPVEKPAVFHAGSPGGAHARSLRPPAGEPHDAPQPVAITLARFRRPQVFGMVNGREVLLQFFTRPSAEGRLVVVYLDSEMEEEISIGEVVLTRLTEKTR